MKLTTIGTILLFISFWAYGQEANFQTFEYYSNDTLSLELNFFAPNTVSGNKTPLFIFVHGGGFSGGNRESGHNICSFLADHGIASASISYSLYMKGKNFSCDGILSEKMKAIQMASNQLWLATEFFVKNAGQFNINPKLIFNGGSSAGAETVLQATFGHRNLLRFYDVHLPESFKFAGMVSGAGAMADINNLNSSTQVPSLFFHGTCDPLVPYATAPHHYCNGDASGWMMLFGAYTLHQKLVNELNGTSYLVSYCGGEHEYAGKPFSDEQETILWFINKTLLNEKFQIHRIVETEKNCELNVQFDFCNE